MTGSKSVSAKLNSRSHQHGNIQMLALGKEFQWEYYQSPLGDSWFLIDHNPVQPLALPKPQEE